MNLGSSPWTPDADQALADAYAKGASFSAIAADLNAQFGTSFSRNAAIGRAHRLGLQRFKVRRPAKTHADATDLKAARDRAAARRPAPPGPEPAPQPEPAPALTPTAEPVPTARLSLVELRDTTCKFPLWVDRAPAPGPDERAYCGAPVPLPGPGERQVPYCGACRLRAFAPREQRRRHDRSVMAFRRAG